MVASMVPGRVASAIASPMTFLTYLLVGAVSLGVASYILPGVRITSWPALIVAALVLGFVNTLVRPLLVLITLPITIVTLGLFYLVVNGLAFGLAAAVVPGFDVDSFGWAVLGALVTGLGSWFVGSLVKS
jgi:putative membrane protein